MTVTEGVTVDTDETAEKIDDVVPVEETDTTVVVEGAETVVAVEEVDSEDPRPPPAVMVAGAIVAAILVFLAQRSLRKRPPELVRGPVGLWRVAAMVPPGAVAYLLFGRRKAEADVIVDTPVSITG